MDRQLMEAKQLVSMPHAALLVVQAYMPRPNPDQYHVSMPHAALLVVQVAVILSYFDTN